MPPSDLVQEMVTKLSVKMTADGMTDVINHIAVFRDEKRKAEERIATAKANASNVQAKQRANKKKSAKQKKASKDGFDLHLRAYECADSALFYFSPNYVAYSDVARL